MAPDPNRIKLLCDDCGEEIFRDDNMVILKDELWNKVCKGKTEQSYCDCCIEKRLKRPIEIEDLKEPSGPIYAEMQIGKKTVNMLLANAHWYYEKRQKK